MMINTQLNINKILEYVQENKIKLLLYIWNAFYGINALYS